MNIENLKQFYEVMLRTRKIRASVVNDLLENHEVSFQTSGLLRETLDSLTAIPQKDGQFCLPLDDKKDIHLDLSYEINELEKDIFFLEHGEEEFMKYLDNLHGNFEEQVNKGVEMLSSIHFKNFITDRDGTVNNYCGRYASSIQSIYNALFLTRFANNCVENAIILTSAPLDNIGLADMSTAPENTFIYAGSKGREYFDKEGKRCQFPIEKEKEEKLKILNDKLKELLAQPGYQMFSLIGSGLQYKFGQTTIAHQDITHTIPEEESETFLNLIKNLVKGIDPENKFFRIEDTGLDIEIILTIDADDAENAAKDFDKGDGILFIDEDLNLDLAKGPNLICGDTNSDIPMILASMKKTTNTYPVFVTKDEALRHKIIEISPNAFIVSEPDVLVAILNSLGHRT